MFKTKVMKKIKKHFLCSMSYFPEICAVYNITWKNIAGPKRPQMTILPIFTACWRAKSTNTHSKYVIQSAFPLQQWLGERASIFRPTYVACLILFQFFVNSVILIKMLLDSA
jgi:hypothetical protein